MSNKNSKIKQNKIKKEKNIMTDEQAEIRNFIIILITIVVIVIAIFFFTKYVINDGDVRLPYSDSQTGSVVYDMVTVGTMLSKSEEEYYVLSYSSDSTKAPYYANLVNVYMASEDSLSVYYLNTDDNFNKDYLLLENEEENTNPANISELTLGELTLIKVEEGKMEEYYSTLEDIENILNESEGN